MTFIQDRPRNMSHQIMGYRKSHLVAMELNDYEKNYYANIFDDYDLKRLQITVSYHNNTAYKFAKSLYFKKEGVLKKYGPEGADYFMMARFPDE